METVKHCRRADHLTDRHDASPADPRQSHGESFGIDNRDRIGECRQLRCGHLLALLTTRIGFDGDRRKRRAITLHAREVEVATVLMNSRLTSVWSVDRLHGQTVALVAAVATPLADPLVDHDPKPRGGERAATPRPSIFGGAGLIVNHYGRAGNLGKQALCLGDAAAVPHVNIGWHHNTVETVGVVSRDDDPLDALGDQHGGDLRHIGGTLRVLAAGHRHGAVVQQFVGDVHTGCDRRPDRQRTGMKERAVAEILDEMPAFDERCHTDPLGPFVAHTRETDELADPLGFHERHH